jgi:hypothetical protein
MGVVAFNFTNPTPAASAKVGQRAAAEACQHALINCQSIFHLSFQRHPSWPEKIPEYAGSPLFLVSLHLPIPRENPDLFDADSILL